jgi:hypothetical protein
LEVFEKSEGDWKYLKNLKGTKYLKNLKETGSI